MSQTETPKDRRYTREHEWAKGDAKRLVVGVTAHAQEALGDVVYVELPKEGATLTAGQPFGVVESTKAVSELFAPISGKVLKVNDKLTDAPHLINEDPYGTGWICEVEPATANASASLMDAAAYDQFVAQGGK